MNPAHLHLLLNHLPMFCGGFSIFLFLYGWVRKQDPMVNLACVLLVLNAGFAFIAHQTGEQAEHLLEGTPGFSEEAIEHHEERTKAFLITCFVSAVFAASLWWTERKTGKPSRVFRLALAVAGLALFVTAWMSGSSGGAIHHSEAQTQGTDPSIEKHEAEDRD
jgi:uncharacterized membrane protein